MDIFQIKAKKQLKLQNKLNMKASKNIICKYFSFDKFTFIDFFGNIAREKHTANMVLSSIRTVYDVEQVLFSQIKRSFSSSSFTSFSSFRLNFFLLFILRCCLQIELGKKLVTPIG